MTNATAGDIPLDLIGIELGTDKSSLAGDYLRHYEALFSSLRDDQFNLIEIGVFHGASVKLWPKFFSRAQIVGIDINPACRAYSDDRVAIEIGSQDDPEFLHKVVSLYPPQIIIDDGSHRSDHVIFAFERLFPALLPGGIYVVEDLHFHLNEKEAERLRGISSITASDYFVNLIKDRMGGEAHVRTLVGLRRYLIEAIDWVQVVAQAAIIKKKQRPDEPASLLAALRPHVERSNDWLNWYRFSQLLSRHDRPLPEVVAALRNALACNKSAVIAYERLSEALEKMGDLDGARSALEQAVSAVGGNAELATLLRSKIARLKASAAG